VHAYAANDNAQSTKKVIIGIEVAMLLRLITRGQILIICKTHHNVATHRKLSNERTAGDFLARRTPAVAACISALDADILLLSRLR
jgi:hypothetical protein